ncbi:phosphate transport-domain-containing protein [Baffinella frigidus]|nr:phosphate transport-domain-containing protein [Cryptophyta sp. CCMP2293]
MLNLIMPAVSGLLLMTRLDKSPQTIMALQFAFVLSCLYCTAAFTWISMLITRKQDTATFVGDPKKGQTEGQVISKHDYDQAKLREMFTSYFSGIMIATVMHFFMGEQRVLLMATVYNPFMVVESPLFRIHLLEQSDQDPQLTRPFLSPSLFGATPPPAPAKAAAAPGAAPEVGAAGGGGVGVVRGAASEKAAQAAKKGK